MAPWLHFTSLAWISSSGLANTCAASLAIRFFAERAASLPSALAAMWMRPLTTALERPSATPR